MGRSIVLAGMLLIAAMAISGGPRVAVADETGPASLLSMAQAAEARGDNRMAIALYQRAQEAFPWESAPLTGWGLLAARLGAAEQAATLLTAALDIDPDDIDAAAGLADVMMDLQRPDEALALYAAVLSLDPAHAAARDGQRIALTLRDGVPATDATPAALSGPSLANAVTTETPTAPVADPAAPVLLDTSLPTTAPAGSLWR
ncbi:tetratricopeptide repeat protein [Thalassobaculum sp. OXR-137]|uniref:tetratricopeptide repeat protein n=1 Tax=Thalassobaculum sp. OXR-137 TaxID=3100173 RepID=UPI002AC95C1D|nr:tetratricopeptide repeat protein [Thalassobaculum sp. OXR-137]WPZ32968.1 tetratricopeptide repeat protein [Thalassobaculum sp. OXR-137]